MVFLPPDSIVAVSEFLPEQTADDTDLGWGERQEDDSDAFYLENKPPHW
ncbi:hypothetical protein GCM10018965_003940 [Nonomuraea roseola]